MNNISKEFDEKKALIPFITCGYPSLEATKQLVIAMEKAGADIIELGIPFSDPTVECATVQNANICALAAGTTTDKIFETVRDIRHSVKIPLVFLTYANVVFSYGTERFIKKCKDVGINGLILNDVPFEEKREFSDFCKQYELDFISVIATTSNERIDTIVEEAEGFLYCVSSSKNAATRTDAIENIHKMVLLAHTLSPVPCAIELETATEDEIKKISKYVDGVIIASGIVKLCEIHGENCIAPVIEYIKAAKSALN